MNKILLNRIFCYHFSARTEMLDFITDKKKILIAINAEKIINNNPTLNTIINNNIGYADGIGAVKALKKKGLKNVIKIPCCEFWLDIIKKFEKEKTFYFIGSSSEVLNKTIEKLIIEFPNINIVNHRNGFLKEGEKEKLIKDLQNKKPDVVFVAQGTPRQEYLMEELLNTHPALYMGLGGSFDVYTGNVKRAPKFFIKLGLEWFYRLLKQPTRIKRQIVLIKFFILLLFNKI